jgi:hypothetical protein
MIGSTRRPEGAAFSAGAALMLASALSVAAVVAEALAAFSFDLPQAVSATSAKRGRVRRAIGICVHLLMGPS